MENEKNSVNYSRLIKGFIIVCIIIGATLPFHYIMGPSNLIPIRVYLKENLTFSNTFVFQREIKKIIEKYNKAPLHIKEQMQDTPLFKKLVEKNLIKQTYSYPRY